MKESVDLLPRDHLYFYFLQNNQYPEMVKGVDKSLSDSAWKDYPPTIVVHGDADDMVLLQASKDVIAVIGKISLSVSALRLTPC